MMSKNVRFGEHIKTAIAKAEKTMATLMGLMPNIGGPNSRMRAILCGVVHSVLLYGAPIWYSVCTVKKFRDMLVSCQRKFLIRVIRAYRTVSGEATQVVAAIPPIDLLAKERHLLQTRRSERG